jgi:ketosteroid isomerase-like protein
MSQENIEIVRQALLVSSGGDVSASEAFSDPSIEWDMSGVTGWVEQEVYRGQREVLEFMEGWRQSWEEWHFEVEEVRAGVEGQVFAGIHERAKSAATGVSVDQRRYLVDTLREGRIVRVRMFSERQEALEAAGLEG